MVPSQLQRPWLPNPMKRSLISVTTFCFRQIILLLLSLSLSLSLLCVPPDTVLMLFEQAAAEGVAYEDDWPYYSIHLLARIYVDDMYVFFFWNLTIQCFMLLTLVDVSHVFVREAFAFIISWFYLLGHCH